jgi:large subunit ribosomal protein L17
MRHRKSGRILGRKSAHRTAMYNNMVTSLLLHGRIETTEPKAKELRGFAEAIIQWGIDVQPLIAKGDKATKEEIGQIVHAHRQAARTVKTKEAMARLFGEVATHFVARKGGYTRMLKTRVRKGDAAPMAYIELVGLNGQ